MKTELAFPCNQDWSRMKIGMSARFCCACQKDVVDFTDMTKAEVLIYLLENRHRSVCGRIQRSKLDEHRYELIHSLEKMSRQPKYSNKLPLILMVTTLLMLGYPGSAQDNGPDKNDEIELVDGIDTNHQEDPIELASDMEVVLQGEIVPVIDEYEPWDYTIDNPATVVEEPATYPGGINTIHDFINENMQYHDRRVEGRVYVSFVIDKVGNMHHLNVIKGLNERADAEAIRLMKMLKRWSPASIQGIKVPVKMVFPVIFHSKKK